MNQISIIEAIENGATIVTATQRLAREYRRQYDQAQLAQSKTSWSSADILPWESWLQRLWNQSDHNQHLISDLQQRAIWQDIISADVRREQPDRAALWSFPTSARAAITAWRMLHQWSIALNDCATSWHPDHRCFYRWANRYQLELDNRSLIDSAGLADHLGEQVNSTNEADTTIILSGFDRLLPQQKRLVNALKSANAKVSRQQPVKRPQTWIECYRAESASDEWQAAASWARQQMIADPAARLAIVTPDLGKHRLMAERQLTRQLTPLATTRPGKESERPFHISLGRPLSAYPMIADALALLALAAPAAITFEAYSQVIRSRYITGAVNEKNTRSKLELWCRRWCPWQMTLEQFIRQLQRKHSPAGTTPMLCEQLNNVRTLKTEQGGRHSLHHWMRFFSSWLEAFGWPGEAALDSQQFQTLQSWQDLLQQLASLDHVQSRQDIGTALGWLQREAGQRIFQPQALDASVQIMGLSESNGLQFDAIWFAGLSETDWPAAARPNPFLPIALQREAGVEAASIEARTTSSRRVQQRLFQSAAHVVVSHTCYDGEIFIAPSPLIANITISEYTAATTSPAEQITHSAPLLEQFDDHAGLTLENTQPRGGSSIIADQAACPFRAYARHRLAADFIDAPQPGLDALDRGTIVHRSLERIWSEIGNSQRLKILSQQQIAKLIERTIRPILQQSAAHNDLGDGMVSSQARHLKSLLLQWLELEKTRNQEFTVESIESEQQFRLSGIQLKLRVDRVDRLADGSVAIIDYKTGQCSLTDWAGERPDQPQLPLYAIAHNEKVETLAFARVKAGDLKFIGLSEHQAQVKGIAALQNSRSTFREYQSWHELLDHWRNSLTNLAAEFIHGHATVTPKDAGTCNYCNLSSFCRIDQQ